jgi:addiction module HigA family antidote
MRAIHPGEILNEEYVKPLHMNANSLARALRVPATRISEILKENRGITPDTAMRLACFFGGDAQSWLNLQSAYDLKKAEMNVLPQIKREVLPRSEHHPH